MEVAELAAGRVRIVHLKDVDRRLAEQVAKGKLGFEEAVRRGVFKALGDGDVDTERVIGVLEESGYGGWYVLEQDIMLDGEPERGKGPSRTCARVWVSCGACSRAERGPRWRTSRLSRWGGSAWTCTRSRSGFRSRR